MVNTWVPGLCAWAWAKPAKTIIAAPAKKEVWTVLMIISMQSEAFSHVPKIWQE